jgi:hypothetical protein
MARKLACQNGDFKKQIYISGYDDGKNIASRVWTLAGAGRWPIATTGMGGLPVMRPQHAGRNSRFILALRFSSGEQPAADGLPGRV